MKEKDKEQKRRVLSKEIRKGHYTRSYRPVVNYGPGFQVGARLFQGGISTTMRLVTFRHEDADSIGALRGDQVVLLTRAYACYLHSSGIPAPLPLAAAQLPDAMLQFLAAGERALAAARRAVGFVEERSVERRVPTGLRGERLMMPLAEVELLAPIPRPGKLLCLGLNYRDHAAELDMKLPERPLLFSKYPSCVVGPDASVVLPSISNQVDYEAELAVVIGRITKGVSEEEALECVAGYTALNDVSARDAQFGDGQWTRGKSYDTFAPLGPALITRDEIDDPHNLAISFRLNGVTMQNSTTRNLVFGVPQLIAFLSQAITLEPGDVIATGTPAGVGHNRKPPVYLKPGDVMEVEVEGIGVLQNPLVAG